MTVLVLHCAMAALGTAKATGTNELVSALAFEGAGRQARIPIFTDAIEARLVAEPHYRPLEGAELEMPDGSKRSWKTVKAEADGSFGGSLGRGGFLWFNPVSDRDQIVLLEARGHGIAYVNGEPHAGDPYGYGYARIPVQLHRGTNDILIGPLRGKGAARLVSPAAPIFFNLGDTTLPDLVAGATGSTEGAVIIVNATTNWFRGSRIESRLGGSPAESALVPSIPPLGFRKVGFPIHNPHALEPGKLTVSLRLVPGGTKASQTVAEATVEVRIRKPTETRKITFRSEIDGSVQYYALNPASPSTNGAGVAASPGLVLSLHGASVEAIGQADAYAPKPGIHLVCPTNRRPYGFDWEEWGRMDAIEVLNLAQKTLQTDPRRTYLTGHSMGGHGTWINGVTFPGRFAAIAPSAGWISFASYAGGRPAGSATNAVDALLRRASASSDTLGLATNYLSQSIYIVHGDADDNVPVGQARTMRAHLAGFHPDVRFHEQPGAGHWWDGPAGGGADCVDWPPAFAMFDERRLPDPSNPADPESLRFVTVNPGVSARHHWATVEAQEAPLEVSEIQLTKSFASGRIEGRTHNVARLGIRVGTAEREALKEAILDDQRIPLQKALGRHRESITFERLDGRWSLASGPASPRLKNPDRNGPFKEAFQHRMLFVYGTRGTAEENAWAFAKARFDAEAFWYRGNGSVEMLPDADFKPGRESGRGVVVYGHREMNSAWNRLLKDCPIEVRRGEIRIGSQRVAGDDLLCAFLRPRPDDPTACVAVVAGSGMRGMRATNRLPYFTPGAGFPDCLVARSSIYAKGNVGVVSVGFFGNDWSVERGVFAGNAQ